MPDTQTYSDDDIVGIMAAAEVLGVSHDTVKRRADAGDLPHTRTGPPPHSRRRFRVGDLRAAQAAWSVPPDQAATAS